MLLLRMIYFSDYRLLKTIICSSMREILTEFMAAYGTRWRRTDTDEYSLAHIIYIKPLQRALTAKVILLTMPRGRFALLFHHPKCPWVCHRKSLGHHVRIWFVMQRDKWLSIWFGVFASFFWIDWWKHRRILPSRKH